MERILKSVFFCSLFAFWLLAQEDFEESATTESPSGNSSLSRSGADISGDEFFSGGRPASFEGGRIYGKRDIAIYRELIDKGFVGFQTRTPFSDDLNVISSQSNRTAKEKDPELLTYELGTKEFDDSRLAKLILRRGGIKAYFLVKLKSNLGSSLVNFVKYGYAPQGDKQSLLNVDEVLVYGHFRGVRNLMADPGVSSVSIARRLSVVGYYSLDVRPQASMKEVTFSFATPHSSRGHELKMKEDSFRNLNENLVYESREEDGIKKIKMDLIRGQNFSYLSELRYTLDLEDLLSRELLSVGQKSLSAYQELIASHRETAPFLEYKGKVDESPFLDSFAYGVKPNQSLASIWLNMTKVLDRAVIYDYQKRKDFFNGNIVYSDIRDMYLTASELVDQRIGACPERSSLEAAMFRKLGVATRISTRLFHIYVEVYVPGLGWVTTSPLLREIPIISSKDGDQSYFVDWDKSVPLKIQWKGWLNPVASF